MRISSQLFSACSYFIPRIMFLDTNVAPKVEWGDVAEVLSGLTKDAYDISSQKFWDEWFIRWKGRADWYIASYQKSPDSKFATNCLRRACASYHWAEFMYFSQMDKKVNLRSDIRKYFLLYLENVEIAYRYNKFSYDGIDIPYFVFYPDKKDNIPTMIICNGLDSMTEIEIFSLAEYFLNEGFAVVLFDPPGQGIHIGRYPLQLEIENIMPDIIGIIKKDGLLNSNLIGIAGISFGGYFALRAAHFLPDCFRFCINISGALKVNEFGQLPRRLKEDFKYVFQKTDSAMQEILDSMFFGNLNLKFPPTISIHGGRDDIFPLESIHKMDEQLGTQHRLILFKDESHVCLNKINQYIYEIIYWAKQYL